MHRHLRSLTIALVGLLAFGLGAAVPANAAAKRVVALEWDGLENLSTLGVSAVGAADVKGYDAYVGIGRRGTPTDVGLRQSPSLSRIRQLKPDLIIVPDYRSERNLSALKKIAKVLVTHPYPAGDGDVQFNAMVTDYRRIARAVGKRRQGEAVLKAMTQSFSAVKGAIARKGRSGIKLTVATPGGTTSAPALRLATNNSQAAGVLRRIGVKNGWNTGTPRYGFATVGVSAMAQIKNDWVAFVYTKPFEQQIKQIQGLDSFKKLPVMKKRRYRNLAGKTWLFGGPGSARLIAAQIGAALLRG
ncbi:MAG: ABC transporter substrate-binding protein [Patulibacter minatonensis]